MTLGPDEQEWIIVWFLFIWAKSNFDSWLLFFSSQPNSFRLRRKRVREPTVLYSAYNISPKSSTSKIKSATLVVSIITCLTLVYHLPNAQYKDEMSEWEESVQAHCWQPHPVSLLLAQTLLHHTTCNFIIKANERPNIHTHLQQSLNRLQLIELVICLV